MGIRTLFFNVATFSLQQRSTQSDQEDLTLRKTSKQEQVKRMQISSQLTISLLFSALVILSILYLAEFSKLATDGVILDELEARRKRVITENEDWKAKITQLRSLDVVENQPTVKQMKPVDEVIYVHL